MSEKKLIINADDVGLSDAINEAAKKLYQADILTGVSMMSCGRYFTEASRMLRDLRKLEVGVHLTLTGNFAPSTETPQAVSSLLNNKNTFFENYGDFVLPYCGKKIKPNEIYLELANQIRKVKEEGLRVTHLDSHEHIHMFPEILKITIRLAQEFEIPYIRLPLEKSGLIKKSFQVKDLVRYGALKVFAAGRKRAIRQAHLKCNDTFLGHFHSGRLNDDILCYMIDSLTAGVGELAIHPAVTSKKLSEEFPWYKNAPKELDALLNGEWRALAENRDINLISHKMV